MGKLLLVLWVLNVASLCIAIPLSVYLAFNAKEYWHLQVENKNLKMYSACNLDRALELTSKNSGVNGITFGDEYYCVWTKDKSVEEIYNTTNHELLHVLINKNNKHFCGVE